MRPSPRSMTRVHRAASLLLAASTLGLATVARAETGAPAGLAIAALHVAPTATSPTPATETVLKRLPAGTAELTLRGENATRSFTLPLGRNEAARIASFQISLLNAVSLLPERSSVMVAINGTVIATLPATAASKAALLTLKIPTGVLVPGPNTVRVSAALSHRVDCSIGATYELWAALDPALTGFLLPRDVAMVGRTLDDLALEPLAEDGTTRIHLRMDDGADAADIARAGRLVAALAHRAGLQRPVVDAGPALGEGAGFDLAVLPGSAGETMVRDLKQVSRSDGLVIGRDAASGRLVVVLTGASGVELDRIAGNLDKGEQTHAAGGAEAGFRKTFADLGLPTENFYGRHYTATLPVDLPPDFLASNDRARLLIDGAHAASLVEGSGIVFRVNGTLVSSMPLAAGRAERFQHAVVELPLRFFHPGHNDLSIEATSSAVYDEDCNSLTMPHEARLTIAGSSEFDFPDFAHLAALPQIPAAMAGNGVSGGSPVNLYLTDADRGSIGAGLTVLANMAATHGSIGAPTVHLGGPSGADTPGIVIAAADQLPEFIAASLRQIVLPVGEGATNVAPGGGMPAASDAAGDPAPSSATMQTPADTVIGGDLDAFGARLSSAAAVTDGLLRSRGFFFPGTGQGELLPATASTMIIAALPSQSYAPLAGGVPLPRLTRDAAQWLVVTAADAPTYEAGLRRLVTSGRWTALGGEAVALDLGDDTLRTRQPRVVSYLVPARFVLSDVRPILGGIMSDNIVLSIAALLVLMSILGLSTHALIRRMGAR